MSTIYYLEMLDRSAGENVDLPAGFDVSEVEPPEPALNRRFYETVGRPWQWTDRLAWSDEQWADYAGRETLRTWIGRLDGQPVGYFELDGQVAGDVELAYFGLLPDFIGRGLGRVLLATAVRLAWETPGARRVWVHTCTEDHPHALENYQRRGFQVYKTERA